MADSAREVLREVRDLRDLHARSGPQLEAGDHGARVHFHHLGLDAEVAQLQLDEARHRLERLGRIAPGARRRVVEQRERGQRAGARPLEHRHLLFLLDAFALLDLRRGRLDLRRLALGDLLLFLAHHFLARLLHLAPDLHVARGRDAVAHPADRPQHTAADAVHHVEPRDAGAERDRREPHGEQQQRGAEEAHRARELVASERAEQSARGIRQRARREVQRGEPAAAGEREEEAESAQRRRAPIDRLQALAVAEQVPAGEAEHDREQEGGPAEEQEEQVGEVRAERPDQVGDGAWLPGRGERRVGPVVADQRDEQDQRQRAEDPERTLAQSALHVGLRDASAALRLSSSHPRSPERSIPSRNPMSLRGITDIGQGHARPSRPPLAGRASRHDRGFLAAARRVAYHAAP